MITLDDIFGGGNSPSEIIALLKKRSITLPKWSELEAAYEPTKHEILSDNQRRVDITYEDGTKDTAARITVGLEKLTVRRMSEFMFGIPPRRVYHYDEKNEKHKSLADAIEAVYRTNRFEAVNKRRAVNYFAACEFFTIWYLQEKPNADYGFQSQYKLKCRTYSPMDGVDLYALFDEKGDLIAMSFDRKEKEMDEDVEYFETYTATHRYKWKNVGDDWEEVDIPLATSLNKIPGVYMYRKEELCAGLKPIREDLEYTLSRNSDVLAYNSSPVLAVIGEISGDPARKDKSVRTVQMETGGSVQYVTWSQAQEAAIAHINNLLRFWSMQTQLPDLGFSTMAGLGSIGYDARQTLFVDAHLKVGDEADAWYEGLDRETNVIKAMLAILPGCPWSEEDFNAVSVEHVITPFIQQDEKQEIEKIQAANGGLPIITQLDGIRRLGWSEDPEATLQALDEEAQKAVALEASVMGAAQ